MKEVKVYTTEYCPFCIQAKNLLNQRGIPFEEIRVNREDPNEWQAMIDRSGMKTVPQIFLEGNLVGGYQELAAKDREDQLKSFK